MNRKFRLFVVISVICLCIGAVERRITNDTFYMIKLGEYIRYHGVDLIDHYSWVARLPYTYPHWLYDLFIYYIYNAFGYVGLHISNIVSFVVLILVVYYIHVKFHKNEFLAFFVSVMSIFCLFAFVQSRAHVLSSIFFLLEIYFIERLIKTNRNKYIFLLCLCSLVIANIHGTVWLFYFVLFLPFFGEHIICWLRKFKIFKNLFFHKRIMVKRINNINKLFVAFVLCFLMGIFTPSRICYTYVFRIMLGDSQKYIMEHAPLVIIHQPYFLVIICVFLIILIFTDVKIYLKELFMISGLILMCFISIRHLFFFYLIGILYISIIAIRVLNDRNDKTLYILEYNIIKKNSIYCLLLLGIVCFSGYKYFDNKKVAYVSNKYYPLKAVKYIKNNLDYKNIRLYNGYNYGSYLLFNDIPVFIDSRCDLYLKEFNHLKYSIFDDDVNIYINYKKKFNFYKVEYALVSKDNILYLLLNNDDNYQNIYKDKYYVIFKKLG